MFFFGLFIGVLGFRIYTITEEKSHIFSSILHDPTSGVFTNPILDCEFFQNDEFTSFRKLEYKINDLIEEEEKNENVDRVSVYFRDMNTGAWVGVNEKEAFSPASLLKVPVMMVYYKLAEKDPTLLSKDLEFHSDDFASVSLTQNIVPTETLLENQKYKVSDLISRMIINSDNQSQFLLISQLPQSDMDMVYVDLGITIPGVRSTEDFMTVKEYASFFRILYNATYLTREYSEQALSILSKVEYTSALRAGIPDDIILAHKFGERGYTTEDGRATQQLHDCGIVYYPERPYLLCVMTSGEDLTRLSATIKKVSELVYQEVDSLPAK
ncbi:serine hydrolase [Candidatus Roizmanbacteria bacterium]|nr:MAG: serine hydrolase [Candidatus Roizmanbacteria bacterium]